MNRTHVKRLLVVLLWAVVFGSLLFSGYFASAGKPDWINIVVIEVHAACRDQGTQWMVFLCAAIYFVAFTLLAARMRSGATDKEEKVDFPTGSQRFLPRQFLSNPDSWLCGFLLVVAVTYGIAYLPLNSQSSTHSLTTQPLLLLFGAAFGKGVAVWARTGKAENRKLKPESGAEPKETGTESSALFASLPSVGLMCEGGNQEAESNRSKQSERSRPALFSSLASVEIVRIKSVLGVLVLLLAVAALWQPATFTEFQYHGQVRWSGAWDNPNIYGLLMAVGMVLGIGVFFGRLKAKGQRLKETGGQKSVVSSQSSAIRRLSPALWLAAAGLCGYGLFKSYSRGAWLGAVIAVGYFAWQLSKACGGRGGEVQFSNVESGKAESGKKIWFSCRSCFSWFKNRRGPLSVVLFSVVVLLFWQFRNTEWLPARRVFSVANINDFSWRNRVTAWQGAFRMMADRPLAGFGWGRAEAAYRKDYRAPRLDETAAIQMNDFLMLGISTGGPALICFLIYIWLSLRGKAEGRKQTLEMETDATRCPTLVCHAGAIALLVGFWFDGGLFKLPTAVVFWTLLELGRIESGRARQPSARRFVIIGRRRARSDAPYRPAVGLRWLAGILGTAAVGLSAVHWITPQFAVNDTTLSIARRFLVPPKQRSDFSFLATNVVWRGKQLKTLLEHVELANYNRQLVSWTVDDRHYHEFVLSPQIEAAFDGRMDWRRPLWEYFYPRIRKEMNPETAAEIVGRDLRQRVSITKNAETEAPGVSPQAVLGVPSGRETADTAEASTLPDRGPSNKAQPLTAATTIIPTIRMMWNNGVASAEGFETLYVAALRSVGIAARLDPSGLTEFWTGERWVRAPHQEKTRP